jgi:Response regulator containing CheY-like receiver, AAA-type ATPase, and DNA-binding domains
MPGQGNVRELKNVIERSIVLSEDKEEITDDAIQLEIAGGKNLNCRDEFEMFEKKIPIKEIEEKYISYLLSKGHTRAEIADIIGESERSVYRKLSGIKN